MNPAGFMEPDRVGGIVGRAPATLWFHVRVQWTSWRLGGAKVRMKVLAELPRDGMSRLERLLVV
ncbi:hypothetical protein H8E07_10310 [bacterium]|nr:hypothetical protein [bacterium]